MTTDDTRPRRWEAGVWAGPDEDDGIPVGGGEPVPAYAHRNCREIKARHAALVAAAREVCECYEGFRSDGKLAPLLTGTHVAALRAALDGEPT